MPPCAPAFATVALPVSDRLRSGAANNSSLSATMLAVRSGSAPSRRTRPVARKVAARAVELDLLEVHEIVRQRDPHDAVLQLHALIDERGGQLVAEQRSRSGLGLATVPPSASFSARWPSSR